MTHRQRKHTHTPFIHTLEYTQVRDNTFLNTHSLFTLTLTLYTDTPTHTHTNTVQFLRYLLTDLLSSLFQPL